MATDNVIKLTKANEIKQKSVSYRGFMFLVKVVLLTAATIWLIEEAHHYIQEGKALIEIKTAEAFERYRPALELTPKQLDVEDVINAVAKEEPAVPAEILWAVVDKESAGGKYLHKFEPQVLERLERKKSGVVYDRHALASSHGLAHVMGWRAEECGLHWSELYHHAKNVRCAKHVLLSNYRSAKGEAWDRWREALRRYNGSGEMAEAYADSVMARVVKKLGKNLEVK